VILGRLKTTLARDGAHIADEFEVAAVLGRGRDTGCPNDA